MPRKSRSLQFVARALVRFWIFVQIGRVRVIGGENLNAEGRLIFCGNHSNMFDGPIVFSILKKQPRYMTAYEEMRGWGGLKAVLLGAIGCFPVDRARGRTAVAPAVEALASGENLAIFPEGKVSNSGRYLKFKSGAARIAIEACDRHDHTVPVAIVPVHLCYGKRHEATAGGPFHKMGFKWRGGVIVTIGEAIYIHNIEPLTARNVTDVVRKRITQQECATAFDVRD